MGERPVGPLLVKFSLPAIVAMLVNATYNIVDTAFVGKLGHEAIAALTLVWPLQLTMIALSFGVGVGANSLIARLLGAGDKRQANHAAAQAFLLGVFSGLVVMAVALLWTDPILRLLGARPDTLPLAREYMRTLMWFAPLVFFPMVANNLLRAEGNPVLAMSVMIISGCTNILLDPLFIFGIGPFPALGVRGAAVATVIARFVAAVLFICCFAGKRSGYRFRLRHFIPWPRLWGRIYAVGAPSMVIQLSGSVVATVANNILAGFGSIPLAAYGVVFRLFSFAFLPCLGLSQGTLSLTGYNFGAGKLTRVREIIRKGALSATAITTFFSVLFIAVPRFLVALFNREPVFLDLASHGLRVAALAFAPVGALVVFTAFFQGIGRAVPAMCLSLARQVLFFLPALILLAHLFGVEGFWFAIPISDVLAAVASVVWTAAMFRRLGVPLFARTRKPD